jgi:hypothetical protein
MANMILAVKPKPLGFDNIWMHPRPPIFPFLKKIKEMALSFQERLVLMVGCLDDNLNK